MFNVFEVADVIVDHIRSQYPNDIAVIGYYGSYAQGTATERSDLDFFFIPGTPDGSRHSLQFIVNDISFDFWLISWERAGRMASFDEGNTSIIADCELLYVRSEDDRKRFMQLRQTIVETAKDGKALLKKAESRLRDVYIHLYNMSRLKDSAAIGDYRHEAREVVINVLSSVALMNRTYFRKGWGKNTAQIHAFGLKPDQLEPLMEIIIESASGAEIRDACQRLTQNTLELLLREQEKYARGPAYPDRLRGFYEEVKGVIDKVLTACERNDSVTAYFWAIGVQKEIARFLYYAEHGDWPIELDASLAYQTLYKQSGFPDLSAMLGGGSLSVLFDAVERLDALLVEYLRKHGVGINRFRNTEQLAAFLKTANPE